MSKPYDLISEELLEGEEILWRGRPSRWPYWGLAFMLSISVILAFIFVVPLIKVLLTGDFSALSGISLTVNGEAVTEDSPISVIWFFLGFAVFASFAFSAMAFGWALGIKSQIYALTDRRVILISQFPYQRMRTYSYADLVSIVAHGSEGGTLEMIPVNEGVIMKLMRFYRVSLCSFHLIPDLQAAKQLIVERIDHSK